MKQAIDTNQVGEVLALLKDDVQIEVKIKSATMSLTPLQYAAMTGKLDICQALYKGEVLDREEIIQGACPISGKNIDKTTDVEQLRRDTDGQIVFIADFKEMVSKLAVEEKKAAMEKAYFLPVKLHALEYAMLHDHLEVVKWFMGFEYCQEIRDGLLHIASGLKKDHMISILQDPETDSDHLILLYKLSSHDWALNKDSAEIIIRRISDLVAKLSCNQLCKFMGVLREKNMKAALVVCAYTLKPEKLAHQGLCTEWVNAMSQKDKFVKDARAENDEIAVAVMERCSK